MRRVDQCAGGRLGAPLVPFPDRHQEVEFVEALLKQEDVHEPVAGASRQEQPLQRQARGADGDRQKDKERGQAKLSANTHHRSAGASSAETNGSEVESATRRPTAKAETMTSRMTTTTSQNLSRKFEKKLQRKSS